MINKIVGKRIILRKAEDTDLDSIYYNVWSDKDLFSSTFFEVSLNKDSAKERLDRTILYHKNNYMYFICLIDTGEVIGFAGILPYSEDNVWIDNGIVISKKYQNMGYGGEVLDLLINLVFNFLNGDKMIYECCSTNIYSKKLCISRGFKYFDSENIIREYDNKKFMLDKYYLERDY